MQVRAEGTTPAGRPAGEMPVPGYVRLHRTGMLAERARRARARLPACDLCARFCRVDRTVGVRGAVCRTGRHAVVHGAGPHFGEEDCLRGWAGSGTIFFAYCNLRCLSCQNHDISWAGRGRLLDAEGLAEVMLDLQARGCHNINLVSPSHVVAQVLEALVIAADRGLCLPLVYNTGGYDSPQALELLDGVVDIYMPDTKYADEATARRLSKVRGYVAANRDALRRMHQQVGDLVIGPDGLARQGLLVRHLVLPDDAAGTARTMRFLADVLSTDTFVNLMGQYRPCHRADERPEIDRRPTPREYAAAAAAARQAGLYRLDGLGRTIGR